MWVSMMGTSDGVFGWARRVSGAAAVAAATAMNARRLMAEEDPGSSREVSIEPLPTRRSNQLREGVPKCNSTYQYMVSR
jgi:hypothetical protein